MGLVAPPDGFTLAPDQDVEDILDSIPGLEKSGDEAISNKGAVGRYQIEPGTATQYGYDPKKLTDPLYSKIAARTIITDLNDRFNGDRDAVLVGYNAGPGVAKRWLASGKDNSVLPKEKQNYLARAPQKIPPPPEGFTLGGQPQQQAQDNIPPPPEGFTIGGAVPQTQAKAPAQPVKDPRTEVLKAYREPFEGRWGLAARPDVKDTLERWGIIPSQRLTTLPNVLTGSLIEGGLQAWDATGAIFSSLIHGGTREFQMSLENLGMQHDDAKQASETLGQMAELEMMKPEGKFLPEESGPLGPREPPPPRGPQAPPQAEAPPVGIPTPPRQPPQAPAPSPYDVRPQDRGPPVGEKITKREGLGEKVQTQDDTLIAQGVSPEQIQEAKNDVVDLAQPEPTGDALTVLRDRGGIRTRNHQGELTKEGQEVENVLRDHQLPGLINNISGESPDKVREYLKENGWFGVRPEDGADLQDFYDLLEKQAQQGNKVYHPESEASQIIERRKTIERDLDEAGVLRSDSPSEAASKLALYRHKELQLEALKERADSLGVKYGRDVSHDELLADITHHEAVRGEGAESPDGAGEYASLSEEYGGRIDEYLAAHKPQYISDLIRKFGAEAYGEIAGAPETLEGFPELRGEGPQKPGQGPVERAPAGEDGTAVGERGPAEGTKAPDQAPKPAQAAQPAWVNDLFHVPKLPELKNTPLISAGYNRHVKKNQYEASLNRDVTPDLQRRLKNLAEMHNGIFSQGKFKFSTLDDRNAFMEMAGGDDTPSLQRAPSTGPEPVFYSQLGRSIASAPLTKAPAKDWLGYVNNLGSKGVKETEIAWSGVRQWLQSKIRPEASDVGPPTKDEAAKNRPVIVTKDEVESFIHNNTNMQVEDYIGRKVESHEFDRARDAVRGFRIDLDNFLDDNLSKDMDTLGIEAPDIRENIEYFGPDKYFTQTNLDLRNLTNDQRQEFKEHAQNWYAARRLIDHLYQMDEAASKYADYVLPGGRNYRELFVTLPDYQPPKAKVHTELPPGWKVSEFPYEEEGFQRPKTEVPANWTVREFQRDPDDEFQQIPFYTHEVLDEEGNQRGLGNNPEEARADALTSINHGVNEQFPEHAPPPYWVTNENEMQWGAGHTPEEAKADALRAINKAEEDKHAKSWNDGHQGYSHIKNPIVRVRFNDRTDADGKKTLFMEEIQPPAESEPMPVELRSSAYDMGLKRMLRYAAENGYDQIAWTRGEHQAERYDLSKHIGRVDVYRRNGRYKINAFDKRGYHITGNNLHAMHPEENLPNLVGKDLADRIVKDFNDERGHMPEGATKTYQGLDLKVGGEGLKNLYDKKLPAFLNKYAKKWNAQTGKARIPTELRDKWQYEGPELTPAQLRDHAFHARDVTVKGQLEQVAKAMARGDTFYDAMHNFAGDMTAEFIGGKITRKKGTEEVHSLPITDSMKKSVVEEGQPLFKRGPGPAPEGEGFGRVSNMLEGRRATPEEASKASRAMAQVEKEVQRLAPKTKVVGAGELRTTLGGRSGEVFGAAFRRMTPEGLKSLIALSLKAPDFMHTARHEVIHALRQSGLFRDREWNALVQASKDGGWITKKLREDNPGLTEEQLHEEAIAEKFADWYQDRNTFIPKAIRPYFQKLANLFNRIRAALKDIYGGKLTANEVMARIEAGSVGARSPEAIRRAPQEAPAFSRRGRKPPGDEEQPEMPYVPISNSGPMGESRIPDDEEAPDFFPPSEEFPPSQRTTPEPTSGVPGLNQFAQEVSGGIPITPREAEQQVNDYFPQGWSGKQKAVNAIEKYTLLPRTLANLDRRFSYLWDAVRKKEDLRNSVAHGLRSLVPTFLKLSNADRAKLYAYEELRMLHQGVPGPNYMPGTFEARNSGIQGAGLLLDQAAYSKPGDAVRLDTPQLRQAMQERLQMFDKAWKGVIEGTARKLGWNGPATSADMLAHAATLRTTGERRRLERKAALIALMEHQQQAGYYIPRMRKGDWAVKITTPGDMGGLPNLTRWELVESRSTADRVLGRIEKEGTVPKLVQERKAQLRQMFPDARFTISDEPFARTADQLKMLDIPAVEKLFSLMGNDVQANLMDKMPAGLTQAEKARLAQDTFDEMMDQVMDQALEELKAGFKKRAKNTPGYSDDFDWTTGAYMNWVSGHIAQLTHGDAIEQARRSYIDNHRSDETRDYAVGWLLGLNQRPSAIDNGVRTARQYTFMYTLGMNAASTMKIMLHAPMLGGPLLSAATGVGRATQHFIAAGAHATRLLRLTGDGIKLDLSRAGRDPAERAYIQDLVKRSVLHESGAEEISAMARQGEAALNPHQTFWRRAQRIYSSMISAADVSNRLTMALAARRAAQQPGAMARIGRVFGKDQSLKRMMESEGYTPEVFGRYMVDLANGIWGQRGRMPMARNWLGASAVQFKNFEINWFSNWHSLASKHGPEGKMAALMMLGGVGMIGGLLAIPFAQNVEDAADWVYKLWNHIDPNVDAKLASLSQDAGLTKAQAEMVMHGPSRALGVDLGTLGFGNVLEREFETPEDIFPVVSVFAQALAKGASRYERGDPYYWVEGLPNSVKNVVQGAIVWPQQGVTTPVMNQVLTPKQITPGEQVLKSVGLMPAEVSRAYQERERQYQMRVSQRDAIDLLASKVAELNMRIRDARQKGDDKTINSLQQERRQAYRDGIKNKIIVNVDSFNEDVNKRMAQRINPAASAIQQAPQALRPGIARSPYVTPQVPKRNPAGASP